MSTAFSILAFIGVAGGVAATVMIASFLSRRGVKINHLLFRALIPKYVRQYREITMEETGKPGPLFYSFIAAWSLALLFAIVAIILEFA
jgi:hypothetical protein